MNNADFFKATLLDEMEQISFIDEHQQRIWKYAIRFVSNHRVDSLHESENADILELRLNDEW